MKKKMILLLLSSSLLFFGCTPKIETVFKDKVTCYDLEKMDKLEEVKIRIKKDDKALYDARKNEIDKNLTFYENQVDRFNTWCKSEKEKDLENGTK